MTRLASMGASRRLGLRMTVSTLLVLLLLARMASGQGRKIVFELMEELPADSPVGNVATASGIESEVTPEVFQGLKYQILSSDGLRIASLFTINSRTGALFTNAMIDREQVCDSTAITCELEFDITVKGDISVIKLFNVVVLIKDKNDNAPSFPTRELALSISEAVPGGSEIPISGAIDRDAGLESVITYWMSESDVFGLREEKLLDVSVLKIVLLRGLDRETESEYKLQIFAKDGDTSSSLTGTLAVTITVDDVNDHSPQFRVPIFNFTVKENAEKGSFVGEIQAEDPDSGENGLILFHFSSLTSSKVLQLFELDPTSGNVTVKAALQYETREKFQAVVEAKDQGGSPRASQAILVIHIIDAGNNPPKISLTLADPLYQDNTQLPEDLPVGSFVGTLKYLDNDEGDNGVVDCESLNSHFHLQSLDDGGYTIEIKSELDREAQNGNELIVIVKCSDRGTPSLSAFKNFTVIISDENDNAPVFLKADYFGNVQEREAVVNNVVQVSAVDADEGLNSEVTYSLTGNSSSSFSVHPSTGWISLIRPVDREAGALIRLEVLAIDRGESPLTGSVMVNIAVEDINDNSPEIIRLEYQVRENLPPGAFVSRIVAADSDDGVNGEVRFSLVSDPSHGFNVSDTGKLMTTTTFDRESKSHHFIVVSVHDLGVPTLSSSSTLTISITDANDHSPEIIYPVKGNDSVELSANTSPGTVVARVHAIDDDLDKNSRLVYLIAEGNPHKLFNIDNATGTIYVATRLTTSRETSYRLTISVQDSGNPRLHSNAYLYVAIDFTNATLLSDSASVEQKYVVIAGVIAGITVVVAVIVVAIIFKLRRTEPGRRSDPSPKTRGVATVADPGAPQEKCEISIHGVSTYQISAPDKEAGFGDDRSKSRDPNTSFESHLTNGSMTFIQRSGLTQDMLDRHSNPSFSLFPEGRQRLVSEDIHSDTSGETTASDSGRGASDAEETTSGASPPLSVHPGVTSPTAVPLVPPRARASLAPAPDPGSIGGVRPTPVYSRDSSSLSDLSRATRAYASHKDMDKARKTPSKVRFSLDDQSVNFRQPGALATTHRQGPLNASQVPISKTQLLRNQSGFPVSQNSDSDALKPMHTVQNPARHYGGGNRNFPIEPRLYHDPRDERESQAASRVPLSRDAVAKHDRFHQRDKYHSTSGVRSNDSKNSYPLLHPRHLPVSPLNRSVDDDDDDGSTTTSGSYAIDGLEDNLNVSIEC